VGSAAFFDIADEGAGDTEDGEFAGLEMADGAEEDEGVKMTAEDVLVGVAEGCWLMMLGEGRDDEDDDAPSLSSAVPIILHSHCSTDVVVAQRINLLRLLLLELGLGCLQACSPGLSTNIGPPDKSREAPGRVIGE